MAEHEFLISIITPVFNAEHTVLKAIESVYANKEYNDKIEMIIVDDYSSDKTIAIIESVRAKYPTISLYQLEKNTGSPSEPRNTGLYKAKGKYVTFLDDDDYIEVDNLWDMVSEMEEKEIDLAKGYMYVVDYHGKTLTNYIHKIPSDKKNMIKTMIRAQSTTVDYIVKRSLIVDNNIRFNRDIKVGEDTVFFTSIFTKSKNPSYLNNFFLYNDVVSRDLENVSSTQNISDREINNQLVAWEIAQSNLLEIGVNYYKLRLPGVFRYFLRALVQYSDTLSKDIFVKICEFVKTNRKYLNGNLSLNSRYQTLFQSLLDENYEEFCELKKKRLLICGHDLKFISALLPYLEDDYKILVDKWIDHTNHDVKNSKALVQQADIIWCEWMLGNAVFYSKIVNTNQRLIIRAHASELWAIYGHKINFNKVDMVITVGYYFFEGFIKEFNIPRSKMRLLPNYVEDSIYTTKKSEGSNYNVGIVGILPKTKGFDKALKLIHKLQDYDSRFTLHVMGKRPEELNWVYNNQYEMSYYNECQEYIDEHQLNDKVIYTGFIEREKLYENVRYVISCSDYEKPESFHLAPAEGAVAGSIPLLLRWKGIEYVYPSKFVFESLDSMIEYIVATYQDEEKLDKTASEVSRYFTDLYGINRFLAIVKDYFKQIFVLR